MIYVGEIAERKLSQGAGGIHVNIAGLFGAGFTLPQTEHQTVNGVTWRRVSPHRYVKYKVS